MSPVCRAKKDRSVLRETTKRVTAFGVACTDVRQSNGYSGSLTGALGQDGMTAVLQAGVARN